MGLKSTYYLRTTAASDVEKSTLEAIPNKTVISTANDSTDEVPKDSHISCRIDGHVVSESECEVCQ
jgi:hypothetical protein